MVHHLILASVVSDAWEHGWGGMEQAYKFVEARETWELLAGVAHKLANLAGVTGLLHWIHHGVRNIKNPPYKH
jgi:hypothetical protein